jgi:PAT family beta-lactamase induction signal transducer AmpG
MPKSAILKVILSRRMLVALIMGYAAGLPLELTSSVLKTWMREQGVNLTVIGLFALVGLPYTLKFFQAPLLDRFSIPRMGRRRGWMLIFQFTLAGGPGRIFRHPVQRLPGYRHRCLPQGGPGR